MIIAVFVVVLTLMALVSLWQRVWTCIQQAMAYRLDARARDAEFSRGYVCGKRDGRWIESKLRWRIEQEEH